MSKYDGQFLPVQRIRTSNKEYDALIYTKNCNKNGRIYACIKISVLQGLLVNKEEQNGYYITLSSLNDEILYTNLPSETKDHQTFSVQNLQCELNISVHIDNDIFHKKMQPLYLFIFTYCLITIISMLLLILSFTHITAKPVLNILQVLDRSLHIPTSKNITNYQITRSNNLPLQRGFRYIANRIHVADQNLGQYHDIISTQRKILQARFMEKALMGQLITSNDTQNFHQYFPEFPESFYLLLVHLWTYAEDNAPYQEPLQLISDFLESEFPNVYQQQINDVQILLLISETDYSKYCQTLNYMVNNVNREEPAYFIRCISSHVCHHLESLPAAYQQLCEMENFSFPD